MAYENVRAALDRLDEQRLLRLHDEVEQTREGSTHEIEGAQLPKETLLQLINQALVIDES
jgi:hypothetical protein